MHHLDAHLKVDERQDPGKSQQQAGCPWRPICLAVPGWAGALPTYVSTEQGLQKTSGLWETALDKDLTSELTSGNLSTHSL